MQYEEICKGQTVHFGGILRGHSENETIVWGKPPIKVRLILKRRIL